MKVVAVTRVFGLMVTLGGVALAVPVVHAQAPAPEPAAPAPAAPAGQPAAEARTFQEGLRYAYIDVQRIATESAAGRAATDKIKAFQDEKIRDLQNRQKQIEEQRQALQQGASVLSEAARQQRQREIERMEVDLQRLSEDAQEDVMALTQQLQVEFEQRLMPVIDRLAREKQLHFVLNLADSGIVWFDRGMDLTGDIIRALDSAPAAGN